MDKGKELERGRRNMIDDEEAKKMLEELKTQEIKQSEDVFGRLSEVTKLMAKLLIKTTNTQAERVYVVSMLKHSVEQMGMFGFLKEKGYISGKPNEEEER